MAAVNVDKLSLKELVQLDARLKEAIAAARARERDDVKRKVAELALSHGFSVSDLVDGRRGKTNGKRKSQSVARYANPADPTDTWTGRGRKPNWLITRLKKGASVEEFAI